MLWTNLVQRFGDRYIVNNDGNKAITATANCQQTVSLMKNIIITQER